MHSESYMEYGEYYTINYTLHNVNSFVNESINAL